MQEPLDLLVKLLKVDSVSGKFSGVLAVEELDKHGEIMDYEKSKPNFEAMFKNHSEATDGKAAGSLRVMHQKQVIGVLTKAELQDEGRRVVVEGEVIDPLHREILVKGGYTGLSIGGLKKIFQGKLGERRYIAYPSESSLVDSPAMYGATVMVKYADGHEEELILGKDKKEGDEVLLKGLGSVIDLASALSQLGYVMPDTQENQDKLLQLRVKAHKLLMGLVKETFSELEVEKESPDINGEAEPVENSYEPKEGDNTMSDTPKTVTSEEFENLQKSYDSKFEALQKASDEKLEKLADNLISLNETVATLVKGFEALIPKVEVKDKAEGAVRMSKAADSAYPAEGIEEKKEVKPVKMEKVHDPDLALAEMQNLKPLVATVK